MHLLHLYCTSVKKFLNSSQLQFLRHAVEIWLRGLLELIIITKPCTTSILLQNPAFDRISKFNILRSAAGAQLQTFPIQRYQTISELKMLSTIYTVQKRDGQTKNIGGVRVRSPCPTILAVIIQKPVPFVQLLSFRDPIYSLAVRSA